MAQATVDCVVVGAGFSGLCAALRLEQEGRSVVVLEARDRVGGRVKSLEVGGTRMCVGGQWLGPGQDRMKAHSDRLGFTRYPTWIKGTKVLELKGKVSTYKSSIPSLPWLHLIELQLLMWKIDRMVAKIDVRNPTQGGAEFDGVTVEGWKAQNIRSKRVRGLIDSIVRVVFGTEAAEISLLRFMQYLRSGGGLMSVAEADGGAQEERISEGTHAIVSALAESVSGEVKLSCPVRRVQWGEAGVTLSTDGGTYQGRRAIFAIPPHLAGRIAWDPGLPAIRDHLLQRYPMGQTTKVFVQYDKPFWRDAGMSGEVVSDGEPLTIVYDNTTFDGQAGLLGFIVGGSARRFGAHPPEERRRLVLEALVRWFGPEAASPVAYHEEDWGADPWTGGCPTANPTPGALMAGASELVVPVGPLHWAGTEMATEWTGYMEGALQSGERAADEVIAALA